MNIVQFETKNVVSKYMEIRDLDEKSKNNSMISLYHDLMSDLSNAGVNLWATNHKYNKTDNVPEDAFLQRYGPQLNLFQSAYVENIQGKILLIAQSLKNLDTICRETELSSQSEFDLKLNSGDVVDHLKNILEYYPIMDNLLKLGELSPKRTEFCNIAVSCIDDAIYRYNLTFAPNFLTNIYSLKNGINHYWSEQFQKPSDKKRYDLMKTGIRDVRGKTDYFKNVIMPLFQNINQHASNPENDIYARINSDDKAIYVTSEIDEDKKIITYTVQDNGLGIRREIMDKIFDKGFSTKTDKTIQHGIGLWSVKNFVEENGGNVWVESELGKGTKFKFTVPYDRKEHDWYVKD